MFHQIDDNSSNWDNASCSMTKKSFELLIEYLLSTNHKFCSLKDIENIFDRKVESNEIYLTFDDAYVDVYNNCFEFLKKYEIPFTVFITTAFIDKPKYLTKDMIIKLNSSHLCTIGAHSVTHMNLRKASKAECIREISESSKILSRFIGERIDYFAYPYGSIYAVSKYCTKIASDLGYKLAFSTLKTSLNVKSLQKPYFLPRFNINEKNCNKFMVN